MKPKEDITAFVDSVIDRYVASPASVVRSNVCRRSSRYYALRITDSQRPARGAVIGIGFRERDVALDFKHVLNEYVRYVDRMAQADQLAAKYVSTPAQCYSLLNPCCSLKSEDSAAVGNEGPSSGVEQMTKDFSLRDGQKIHVNMPVSLL